MRQYEITRKQVSQRSLYSITSPRISLEFSAQRHQVDGTNLKIKEVTLQDGGTYTCRATQSNLAISDFKEMNITLKIQRKLSLFDAQQAVRTL